MNVDDALSVIGGGRFRAILLTTCFHMNMLFGSDLYLMSVIAPENYTEPVGLGGFNHTTVTNQFSLTESQSSLIAGCYATGIAFGAIASGQLADVYGRKPVLIINFALMTISLLITAFASTWQIFAGERFFTGIFQGGSMIATFLLLYEFTEAIYAGSIAMMYITFRSLGVIQVALMGFLLPTWKMVIIAVSCSGLAVPLVIFLGIPESCRWLYAIGNTEMAEDVLGKISKRNKSGDSDVRLARDIGRDEIAGVRTLSSLLGLAKLRNRLLLGITVWFLTSAVYFGVDIGASGLDVGVYWRLALFGALEIPVCLIVMFQMYHKKFGRKGTLVVYLCISALSFAVIAATKNANLPEEATTCIQIFSKIGATGAFALMFVHTSEMFPNQVRGVALGLITLSACAGAIAAHYIGKLESTSSFIPAAVFAAMGSVAAAFSLMLPRTLNRPFPSLITFSTSYHALDSENDELNSINDGD